MRKILIAATLILIGLGFVHVARAESREVEMAIHAMPGSIRILNAAAGTEWSEGGSQGSSPNGVLNVSELLSRGVGLTGEDVRGFVQSHGGTPIIEGTSVVFFVEALSGDEPTIVGDFTDSLPSGALAMERLGSTGFFTARAELDSRARVEYVVSIAGEERLDPLNPRSVAAFVGRQSEIRMPGYRAPAGVENSNPLRGRIESFEHKSPNRTTSRKVFVYLPPGYDEAKKRRYPSVWLNDGTTYVEDIRAPEIAEALIADGLIEPVILVLVDPIDRRAEYVGHPGFRAMMSAELIPLVDRKYRTVAQASGRAIGGGSRGGMAAIDLALARPDLFGQVAAWAPAINPTPLADFMGGRKAPARFVLTRQTYDQRFGPDAPSLAQALRGSGSEVILQDIPEGHTLAAWPGRVAEALVSLFPKSSGKR